MLVQSVRIEQKGRNWAGKQSLHVRSLELFSTTGQFTTGVFRALFREHRHDIHQFLCVSARDFDFTEFHLISPRTDIVTWDGSREWLEIDLIDRQVFVNSYRLKRLPIYILRSWSLIGSNDRTLPLEEWTKINLRQEIQKGEFESFQLYECFGGPFRYFRIVNEGPKGTERLT
jgi:hypothetical protein